MLLPRLALHVLSHHHSKRPSHAKGIYIGDAMVHFYETLVGLQVP